MIEISHRQTRRMLRETLDRRLPEEQWTALQAHLETCQECQAVRRKLTRLEKEVHRSLRSRWDGMPLQHELDPGSLSERTRARASIRRNLTLSGLGLALILAFLFLGGWELSGDWIRSLREGKPTSAGEEPAVRLAAIPETGTGEFLDPVIYEAKVSGKSDLFLLSPGGSLTNLTGSTGLSQSNETAPAWAPDGNWIAYLSDITGKKELYVSGLEGDSPVQLTNEERIEWHGPLSWSPDGRWIALTGVRLDQGGQTWIYVAPIDGSEDAAALAGTRGGWSPEFSPAGNRLAFSIGDGLRTSVAVFYFQGIETDSARVTSLHWTTSYGQGVTVRPGVFHLHPDWPADSAGLLATGASTRVFQEGFGLDWSPDGTGLVYLRSSVREGGSGVQVNAERELDFRDDLSEYALVNRIAESTDPRVFEGVSWTADGAVVFLQQGQPGSVPGCKQLRVGWSSSLRREPFPEFPADLCVTGGLDRSAWSSDGRWLVITATRGAESTPGLYAIRFPGMQMPGREWAVEIIRLSRPEDSFMQAGPARVRPRLRQAALDIQPRGVTLPGKRPAPPSDPANLDGQIVFSLRNNAVTVIVSSTPDGNGGLVLTSSSGNNRCPRFSPDGSLVAFVSDEAGVKTPEPLALENLPGADDNRLGRGGGEQAVARATQEIYVMPSDGQPPRQVSSTGWVPETAGDFSGSSSIQYGCPVWSPDGLYLAAGVSTNRGDYVAILPVPIQHDVWARIHYIRLDGPPKGIAWRDSSRTLVVGSDPLAGENTNRFIEIWLPDELREPVQTRSYSSPYELGAISGMVLSPDGSDVFLLATRPGGPDPLVADVRQLSLENWTERARLVVGLLTAGSSRGVDQLVWLPNGALGIIFQTSLENRYKTYIQHLNPRQGEIETLAAFEDQVYSAAWSDDGGWVVFSAESGLWLLDVWEARRGRASPIWISPEPVYDLDWH